MALSWHGQRFQLRVADVREDRLKLRYLLLVLCLASCQPTQKPPSDDDVRRAQQFFSTLNIAAARNAAKPLLEPAILRVVPTRGELSFSGTERLTASQRTQSIKYMTTRLQIVPVDGSNLLASMYNQVQQGNERSTIEIKAVYDARGMKIRPAEIRSPQFGLMNDAQATAMRQYFDAALSLVFASAGRTVFRQGDELSSVTLDGMVPGAAGTMRVLLVGETLWEGREVLVAEGTAAASVRDGTGAVVPVQMTNLVLVDKKSSIELASIVRGIGQHQRVGAFESETVSRIDPSSLINLP